MLEYKDAVGIINEQVTCITKTIDIDVNRCSGYVCAENIFSKTDIPQFNRARVDGFCFDRDKIQANTKYKIKGEIFAGTQLYEYDITDKIFPEIYRIMTGAEIPGNCNCVIKIEDSVLSGDYVSFNYVPEIQENYEKIGTVSKKDSIVIEKGRYIDVYTAAAIASAGHGRIKVFDKPRISIGVTGDEVVSPGNDISGNQIWDSNTAALKNLLYKNNLEFNNSEIIKDDYNSIYDFIKKESQKSDLIIMSGGVSMGEKDFVHKCVSEMKGKILFHKINIKPGKPVMLAELENKTYVLGLPGNPVSAITVFEIIGILVIKKIAGAEKTEKLTVKAYTDSDYYKNDARLHFVNGKLQIRDNKNIFSFSDVRNSADTVSAAGQESFGLFEGPKGIIMNNTLIDVIII